MTILAVESSSGVAGVALLKENILVYEEYIDDGLTHSEVLLPMIERALAHTDGIASVDRFAVDIGPGSFTGIRIGVCAVNALAQAANKPVFCASSLEILAAQWPYFGFVCAICDARGEQVYGALYNTGQGAPKEIIAPCAAQIDEMLEQLPSGDILFTGDGAIAHRGRISERLGAPAQFAPPHLARVRASALSVMARTGECVEQAEPMYLRVPLAERALLAERNAAYAH